MLIANAEAFAAEVIATLRKSRIASKTEEALEQSASRANLPRYYDLKGLCALLGR